MPIIKAYLYSYVPRKEEFKCLYPTYINKFVLGDASGENDILYAIAENKMIQLFTSVSPKEGEVFSADPYNCMSSRHLWFVEPNEKAAYEAILKSYRESCNVILEKLKYRIDKIERAIGVLESYEVGG